MRLPGVGLRTVRALSLSQQASTSSASATQGLRPTAPSFVPSPSTSSQHRHASVLAYNPLNSFAFPPLLAANMPPPPPQHQQHSMIMDNVTNRFQAQEPELPLYSYKSASPTPTMYYIIDTNAADNVLSLTSVRGPLGFDLEWRPTFAKGAPENRVALLQLADASSGSVYLFHLSRMKTFPEQLRVLLNDATVVKAGVGIQNDCRKLWKDWEVSVQGVVDLSMLARSVDSQWKGAYHNPIGLARLVEVYKHRRMLKSKKLQLSNWELKLSTNAQEYAADDAHAGLVLYQHLHSLAQRKIPVPLPTYYSFDCVGGTLYEQLPTDRLITITESPSLNPLGTLSPDSSGVELTELEEDFSPTWSDSEPMRQLWIPNNPEYDPGPPPPPRPPRVAGPDANALEHGQANERQDWPGTSPSRKKRNMNKQNAHLFSNALPITRPPRHTPSSPPRMGSWQDSNVHSNARLNSRPNTPRDFMKPQPRSASPHNGHGHTRSMPQALVHVAPREAARSFVR